MKMVHGEFESMKAIYTLLPEFAPKLITWGTYETVLDTHFFLCDYREIINKMPDPHKFTSRLAALYKTASRQIENLVSTSQPIVVTYHRRLSRRISGKPSMPKV